MEDIGDILFYIIAAVIGLITTLGKKKKKSAGKPATTTETADNQSFEPYVEEEVPEIEYQVSEEDFRIDRIFSEQVEEEPVSGEKVFTFDPELEGKYSEPLAKEFISEGKQQIDIEEKQEDESLDEISEDTELIGDFDLRKAIIYSEILRRKDY